MQVSDGFRFSCGIALFVSVLSIGAQLIDHLLPHGFDNSDAPPARSGLAIKTDHLTRCEYLMTFTGSLTPRLNADGKQICGITP